MPTAQAALEVMVCLCLLKQVWYYSQYHDLVRVVLDTNVMYAALRSRRGASNALLRQLGTNAFQIVLSTALALEYESVLKREALMLGYTTEDVDTLVDYLCAVARPHPIYFLWRPQLRDPKDDMVLELAVNAACPYIVTFNVRDFKGCERFGVQTVTPADFLTRLGGSP